MMDHQNIEMQEESMGMRPTTRNDKTTGRMYATTRTGGYQRTNAESNASPMSSKMKQHRLNENSFVGALTDTNRYSTQR